MELYILQKAFWALVDVDFPRYISSGRLIGGSYIVRIRALLSLCCVHFFQRAGIVICRGWTVLIDVHSEQATFLLPLWGWTRVAVPCHSDHAAFWRWGTVTLPHLT